MEITEMSSSNELWSKRYELLTELTILIGRQNFGDQWKETIQSFFNHDLTVYHLEECILHLGAYYGLPRALQSFNEIKKMDLHKSPRVDHQDLEVRIKTYMPDQFNFFQQPDIKKALHNVHPDFGILAGTSASWLCSRGILTPLDRAHITLISDIFQNVFMGPYQIHIRMILQSGATPEFLLQSHKHLRSLVLGSKDFEIPNAYLASAEELLPELIASNKEYFLTNEASKVNNSNSQAKNHLSFTKSSYVH